MILERFALLLIKQRNHNKKFGESEFQFFGGSDVANKLMIPFCHYKKNPNMLKFQGRDIFCWLSHVQSLEREKHLNELMKLKGNNFLKYLKRMVLFYGKIYWLAEPLEQPNPNLDYSLSKKIVIIYKSCDELSLVGPEVLETTLRVLILPTGLIFFSTPSVLISQFCIFSAE